MCMDDNKIEFDAYPLDIWALGITLYALIYLKLPFTSNNKATYLDLIEKICNEKVPLFEDKRKISYELKELLLSLLQKDPLKRPTAKDLINNQWLNSGRDHLNKDNIEIIKISDEEIEKSLNFFISTAKNRNYELMWKPKASNLKISTTSLMKVTKNNSNKSLTIDSKSDKSINSNHKIINLNGGVIGKDSPLKKNLSLIDSNYFLQNRSGKTVNMNPIQFKKSMSEEEFFDN